jgi:hypothetical protein
MQPPHTCKEAQEAPNWPKPRPNPPSSPDLSQASKPSNQQTYQNPTPASARRHWPEWPGWLRSQSQASARGLRRQGLSRRPQAQVRTMGDWAG